MKSYIVKTFPTDNGPVISLSEAKLHLRVDNTAEDTLITNLCLVATQAAQNYTNRFFINHVLSMKCDTWEETKVLYGSPFASMTSVQYYDKDDVLQTWDASNYTIDGTAQPPRFFALPDKSYPDLSGRKGAITLTYTIGYGATAAGTPQAIKQACLLIIGNFYENRQEVVIGRIATEVPKSAQYLLDQYKIQVW
tara:strand:- start:2178 stop:2759 length:582 start_codon:yes stop_codon:yes gene_type:complete